MPKHTTAHKRYELEAPKRKVECVPERCEKCDGIMQAWKVMRDAWSLGTITDAEYYCTYCKRVFKRKARVQIAPTRWYSLIPRIDEFFIGPVLQFEYGFLGELAAPKLFTFNAVFADVADNPHLWKLKELPVTEEIFEPYVLLQRGNTRWWGRGFRFDVLWANWKAERMNATGDQRNHSASVCEVPQNIDTLNED